MADIRKSRVLGICGSPVVAGSTEILVKEILRGAESQGSETEFISLNELEIIPCQACGQSPDEGYCFFNDGMNVIYERFDWCDALIVGSPIYFDSVSAQTKLFVDRTNCFRSLTPGSGEKFAPRIIKKRRGAMVLVGGKREEYEYARRVIGGFFVWAGVESKGLITYRYDGFEKGTAANESSIMKKAFDLGRELIA